MSLNQEGGPACVNRPERLVYRLMGAFPPPPDTLWHDHCK